MIPAFSAPNPGGGGSNPPRSSDLFLVQANDVTIQYLTVDGNNPDPLITSGIVRNTVDIDARNGIITNHALGVYNNLNINNVTVKNIYLRGIYASSGGSFDLQDNTVTNVAGESQSIGIMNWAGAGLIKNNILSLCNDAICSNHSSGVTYELNVITTSGSGIHSDNNGDGGGTADIIRNNNVSLGTSGSYGIWVFASYLNTEVYENTVSGVLVGLCASGQYGGTPLFTRNTIFNSAYGVSTTTSLFGWGSANCTATFTNNFIDNNTAEGFDIEAELGYTNTTTANDNHIQGNLVGVAVSGAGTFALDFECNWWGATSVAAVATAVGATDPPVDYTPWLSDGTDDTTPPSLPGFQPLPGSCNGMVDYYVNKAYTSGVDVYTTAAGSDVTGTGTPSAPYATIGKAISVAVAGAEKIYVDVDTYPEDIIVNKSLDIRGPNFNISPNGVPPRVGEAVIHPATSSPFGEIIKVQASDVKINGFTIDGDNPLLPPSLLLGTTGATLDAAEAVTVYVDNVNNLKVTNNIIKNLTYFGVTIFGATYSAPATSGHLVSDNLIKDLGTYTDPEPNPNYNMNYWGGGVLIYNDQYTRIKDNVMTNVRIGIQTGNFHRPNPGLAIYQVIDNNDVQARRAGIFYNLHTGNPAPLTLSNNDITALSNTNETKWRGIAFSSLSEAIGVGLNNTINGSGVTIPTIGYEVWNVKSNAPASITGGSVTGVDIGVFANNYEGYNSNGTDGAHAVITGMTISPKSGGTGIYALDSPSYTGPQLRLMYKYSTT